MAHFDGGRYWTRTSDLLRVEYTWECELGQRITTLRVGAETLANYKY